MPIWSETAGRFLDALRHRARLRTWNSDQALGRRGEDLAHRFLRRQGYSVVARNYRVAGGEAEADIIAWDREHLVFVEVKSRRSTDFGPPERAIDETKKRHLRRAARTYTRRADIDWEKVRFDLVTVVFEDPPTIKLFRGAWQP